MATANSEPPTHERHHNHQHETSHNDRNLAHWDKVASTYNSDEKQREFGDLINKMTEFVLANVSSIGVDFVDPSSKFEKKEESSEQRSVRVLDYACGPGTVTNILAGRATEFVGIDLSPNMVQEYNKRFSSDTGGEKLNAQAYTGSLIDPSGIPELLQDSKFFSFDLVVVGLGFHHFENLPLVTERLVERLKPGGVLMILDFFPHDKDDMAEHEAHNTIAHHGFSESQVRGLFADAGLEDVQVLAYAGEIHMRKHAKRQLFMARGRRPQ